MKGTVKSEKNNGIH